MPTTLPPPDWLSVFNAQPGATLLLSAEWVIVGASDDYLAATLTERATIVGQYIFEAFPDNPLTPEANAVANVRASLAQVMATRQPHDMAPQHYDVPDRTRPGHFVERHWKARHTPVLDAAGQVQYIIQSVQDITASRLAERQLSESRANEQVARADAEQQRTEFRHFIEQAPVAVAVYHGPRFQVAMANATTLAIWGRTLDAVLGRPVFEVMPEAATPEVLAIFERVFTTGTPHTASEQPTTIYRNGRQELVYWNTVFEPLCGPDGGISGLFTVGTDVTAQVVARQQVQQLNQELEARVQERAQAALALQADLLAAAQHQAQQRETFFQVFEQTPACIALLRGPAHRFEYVNAAYQQLFPGRQLVGLPLAEALPETAAQGFVAWMNNVYQTGQTFYGTEVLLTVEQLGGQPAKDVYFTFTYQAYQENGAVAGISIFAHDVTEQVLARHEREAQQRKLYTVFEQAPAGICILAGPELVFEFVNPSYQRLLPGRDLAGRSIFEAMPEIAGTPVAGILRGVYATGRTHEEQALRIPLARPADGVLEDRYFTFVYQARRDERGEVDGILAFVFEVTAQQQAIAAVRESEARFRIMADAAPNQVWAVTPDTTIRYANQAFLNFVGVKSVEEYTATGWAAYLPAEELEHAQRTLGEAIRTRSLYTLEHRMRRHDGEYRWLLSQGAPSFYPNGELYGYVGSAIDITDLKHANEQLTRTNRDLDNFVYAASHDLKQPVHNLAGLLEELLRTATFADPAEEQLLVRMVEEAVQQLNTTIEDLAVLGQAQKASETPAEPVVLADLTEEVLNTLEPQARAARARLTTDFGVRPTVAFARANLRTILLNLVSNALKYADPQRPARIHVSMWLEGGQPVLVVQDNGLGFDAEKYGAELFHLFRRFHTHTAGTGVGLYLVNRIVQANGGRIEVQSQEGAGATFRVYLGCA
ncbi:PAS domain-containing protein [Hymenobacter latericus]|uniref:PAS domain-containing protein n=1 Tax=Hymenobacter sp. YIM 151858-1 TaxID=2987688 RepID=UPI00222718D9|nr:PAS domain-containing protein [Hymenobacter sp. YIM 151858-1]UYZ58073.1 PAS domain-containing protein [Hymenobacter sp. YIM 151858-1]